MSRLATTFGAANFLSAALSGMPVCHGAGGMTEAKQQRLDVAPIAITFRDSPSEDVAPFADPSTPMPVPTPDGRTGRVPAA